MGQVFAKLLGNGLTNYGVQGAPGGPTSYASSPAQMGQMVGADSAAATMPGRSTVDGSLSAPTITTEQQDPGAYGIPMAPPRPDLTTVTQNPDPTTVGFTAPPVGVQPKVTRPSFEAAQQIPGALTKAGLLTSLLLPAITGAANGWAAGQVTNPHIQPGLGGSFAAGVNTPSMLKQQAMGFQDEQLAQDRTKAQIASYPGQMQQEHDLKASEIARNNANADRRDVFQSKSGDILERQTDGTMKTLYKSPEKPDAADSVDGRQQIIAGLKSGDTPYTLSNEQEQQYVLTGKIPTDPKDPNPSQSSLLLSAAGGDKPAMRALQLQSRLEVQTHNRYNQNSSLDGMSAAQQRSLKADSQWQNITHRMNALTSQYARGAQWATPEDQASLSKQIDDLGTQAQQRQTQVLGGKSAGSQSPSSGKVRMTGPKGTFDVPADNVGILQQNGYQRVGR
jgi:hypothetical protein